MQWLIGKGVPGSKRSFPTIIVMPCDGSVCITIKFECKFRNSAYSTVNKQYCSLLFLSGSTIFFKFRLYTKQTLNLRLRNNSPIDSSSSQPAMASCGLTPDSSCPLYQLWRLSCTSTKFAKVGGVFFPPAAPVGNIFLLG